MKKRLLSMAMALAMCLSLLPAAAFAENTAQPQMMSSGTEQTSEPQGAIDLTLDPVPGPDDKWTWDKETSTLTLKDGFRIDENDFSDGLWSAIYQEGNLTIVVEGNASIVYPDYAISAIDGSLTVQMKAGSELNIKVTAYAFFAQSLNIQGEQKNGQRPFLQLWSGLMGAITEGDITVNDCELKMFSLGPNFDCSTGSDDFSGKITLKNCKTTTVPFAPDNSDELIYPDSCASSSGDIIIDGGELNVVSEAQPLTARGKIIFKNDPKLDLRIQSEGTGGAMVFGDPSITIPGTFSLLNNNGQVIYSGTWDNGVAQGRILRKELPKTNPYDDSRWQIYVKQADGSNMEVRGILREKQDNPFTDVTKGDWYYTSVLWAVHNGITSGMTETEFGPFAECNRAQIVTFLWSAAGKPEPKTQDNPFTDVPENAWFHDAVLWAVENGITSGLTKTEFGPTAACNRAQAVTFLWKYAAQPAASAELKFTDVQKGTWYEKPVMWAVENGITSGLSDTEFGTTADCLRSQIVTFLYKALVK